jgi:glyoxylase-like metal-dependent hydrolase (beta-lactamase superfamily II)
MCAMPGRLRALAFCSSMGLLALLVHASAQPPAGPPDPLVLPNTTARLSPHVYVIPDNNIPLVPNVGIIVGERATLVIDTGLGPRNGETVLSEARRVSPNEELYLSVTHVHPEHDLGAQAFPASTTMIRSRDQDADIAEFGLQLANAFASQSPVRAELLRGAAFRKTDISFERDYTIDLGGVRVRMFAVGPTHTRGDTVFLVDGENVVFAGDVVMSAFPAFASPYSSVTAWLAALDRIEAMKPQTIVPSHGRIVDAAMIGTYRDYFRAVQTRTRELKAAGRSADEAAATIQGEMQQKFPMMAQPARVAPAVQAAFREAGDRGPG